MAAKKKSSNGFNTPEMRNEALAAKQARGLHSYVSPTPKASPKKKAATKTVAKVAPKKTKKK